MPKETQTHRKPWITAKWPTSRSPITSEQANHFAQLCEDLIAATRERGWSRVFQGPEYGRLTSGAYACGLVCRDIDGPRLHRKVYGLMSDPEALKTISLLQIRQCIHTIIRAERHCQTDENGDLKRAVEGGSLAIIADCLRCNVALCHG